MSDSSDEGHEGGASGFDPGALRAYGLSEARVAQAREAGRPEGLARVKSVHGIAWDVVDHAGVRRAVLEPSTRGRKAKREARERPVVGDWVLLGGRLVDAFPVIERVLERTSLLSRRAAGTGEVEQPIAANVDVLGIVTSLDADVSERRIERYLVMARRGGVRPVLVCTKADACAPDVREALLERVRAASHGCEVLCTSARTGEGLDALRALASQGVTLAFTGSSGVGKSSLINALSGEALRATGAVRAHDQQGTHTTTTRELVSLPGGAVLVDTPGMRELEPWYDDDAGDEDAAVEDVFVEVQSLAERCRFRDCAHVREPGCAVREAIESGALSEARLASFRALSEERRKAAARRAASAGAPSKRRRR